MVGDEGLEGLVEEDEDGIALGHEMAFDVGGGDEDLGGAEAGAPEGGWG